MVIVPAGIGVKAVPKVPSPMSADRSRGGWQLTKMAAASWFGLRPQGAHETTIHLGVT